MKLSYNIESSERKRERETDRQTDREFDKDTKNKIENNHLFRFHHHPTFCSSFKLYHISYLYKEFSGYYVPEIFYMEI